MNRRRLALIFLGVAVVAVAVGAGVRWLGRERAAPEAASPAMAKPQTQAKTLYHCPMHPTMVSEKPGDCPICQMHMVPVGDRVADAGAASVEGFATIQVPARKQQLIGVRISPVKRAPFVRTIRTVGRVIPDETRLHHVHTKIEGWVEGLYVNATGEKVRRGDPLLSLYSPELLATQEEYLLALKSRRRTDAGSLPEVARAGEELVESARRRLLLFDLTPQQIDHLERSGEASRSVTLFAPLSGYVLSRNVTHGEKIDPSMTLLDVADLSQVWVLASVYEYELPYVRVGQAAAMTLSYLPGRTYRGRLGLIYPVLDQATRTAQVRLEFDNPELELKPDMYAHVDLESDLGERLAVPESAVLASGTRNIVFVAKGDGYFEPREVRLGVRLPDAVEVLEGVSEGESVVTSANFLIDSESRLKAALEATAGPGRAPAPASAQGPAPESAPAQEHRH